MVKSFPAIPIVNVCHVDVSPLSDVILLLKLFQSVELSAPVVVAEARTREMPVPDIERPFGVPEMVPILLLKRFQSEEESHPLAEAVACTIAFCFALKRFQSDAERAPVVVEFAIFIPKTPVVLLYVSGPFAERDVSPIFVATVPERVLRFPERVFTFPERVRILPVAVARLAFVVLRFVVSVAMFPVAVARLIVRLLMLTSWDVLLPWSFWNAERIESALVTVPDPATNPVRREERLSLPENAL